MPPEAQKQLDHFIRMTNLIPAIVLDGVNEELCQLLRGAPQVTEDEVEHLYEYLRSDDTLCVIEMKTGEAFFVNAGFKRDMDTQDPRPAYYGYMRQWATAEVKERFPALHAKIPPTFCAGAPFR